MPDGARLAIGGPPKRMRPVAVIVTVSPLLNTTPVGVQICRGITRTRIVFGADVGGAATVGAAQRRRTARTQQTTALQRIASLRRVAVVRIRIPFPLRRS